VKPREYEDDDRVRKVFARIFGQKKITYYLKPESNVPTYGDIVEELNRQRNESLDKPHYVNALDRIRQDVVDYKSEHGVTTPSPSTRSSSNNSTNGDAVQLTSTRSRIGAEYTLGRRVG